MTDYACATPMQTLKLGKFQETVMILQFLILIAVISAILYLVSERSGKRDYGVKSVTSRGEVVRSLEEKTISDYLFQNGIKYQYEPEVRTRGLFFSDRIGYADFYLSEYDVYVEYWGLVDAPDKRTQKRYVKRMRQKMAQYYKNNIKFISIYPRNLGNLDWIFRKKFKKVAGFELPYN